MIVLAAQKNSTRFDRPYEVTVKSVLQFLMGDHEFTQEEKAFIIDCKKHAVKSSVCTQRIYNYRKGFCTYYGNSLSRQS